MGFRAFRVLGLGVFSVRFRVQGLGFSLDWGWMLLGRELSMVVGLARGSRA